MKATCIHRYTYNFCPSHIIVLVFLPFAKIAIASCPQVERRTEIKGLFREGSDYFALYDTFLRDFSWHAELRRKHVAAMRAGNFYIDLAGGTGLVALDLHNKFPNSSVNVVDISADMMKFASKKGLPIHLSDIRSLRINGKEPVPDSVDGITWNNGAYFLSEPEIVTVMTNNYRYMKPGARISISSLRPVSVIQKLAVKTRGTLALLGMVVKGELSWSEMRTIIRTTKQISEGGGATLLNASQMSAIGGQAGFKVLEATDLAYGGLNFFVVFEK